MTGVAVGDLSAAAALRGEGASVMVLTSRGAEQHSKGTDTALAFINLALALGQMGRPHAGFGTVTGQGNGQGGRERGRKADHLPGYRRIDDPAARAHVAGVWGVDAAELPGPGVSAYEMLDALGTDAGVRALLVMGSNVVVSAPHAGHVQDRLDALDLLVVADLFLSETAERADVVLPSTQWAEEEGTMTNFQGRVALTRRALPPPDAVPPARRPAGRALPGRHQVPPRADPAARPAGGVRRYPPRYGRDLRHRRRRYRHRHDGPRFGPDACPPEPDHPAGHAVRPLSLGGHVPCQPAHQSGARPEIEDAGVQGLCGTHREGEDLLTAATPPG